MRLAFLALVLATAIVLPSLHFVLRPSASAVEGAKEALLARQDHAWEEAHLEANRSVNPEWDLGHHTFYALSLVNLAIVDSPSQQRGEGAAAADMRRRDRVDQIIDEIEAQPPHHFHLPYFRNGHGFRDPSAGSIFLNGERLLLRAARLAVWRGGDASRRDAKVKELARALVAQMDRSPSVMAESYPDECWMFDNTLVLAALEVAGAVLGQPVDGAEALKSKWLRNARRQLIDPHTGLLYASTTWNGEPLDGPEGSSAFGSAHFLQLIDADLAAEQYALAKKHFVKRPLGFAFAKEWPDRELWGSDRLPPRASSPDVDSGPIIPLVHASAGASGMAILGSSAFGDQDVQRELLTSLELAAFPAEDKKKGERRYQASNVFGDAVILYALTQGPLWQLILSAKKPTKERS